MMTRERFVNIASSLLMAATVAGLMVLFDAPTWAWVGIGLTVYLAEIEKSIVLKQAGK